MLYSFKMSIQSTIFIRFQLFIFKLKFSTKYIIDILYFQLYECTYKCQLKNAMYFNIYVNLKEFFAGVTVTGVTKSEI